MGIDVHFRLAGLAGLGRDEDDAGIGPAAVNRRRGGILEDFHPLDIVGVDVGIALCRDSVHHIERGGRSVDGTDTPDNHIRGRPRNTGGTGDTDTSHPSLKGFHRVHFRSAVNLVHPDGGDRRRNQALGGGAVTDDHDFLQQLAVFLERYRNKTLSRYRYRFRLESEEGYFQHRICGNAEGERSVRGRNGSDLGSSLQHDGGSRNGSARHVINCTAYADLPLRSCTQADAGEQDEDQ